MKYIAEQHENAVTQPETFMAGKQLGFNRTIKRYKETSLQQS